MGYTTIIYGRIEGAKDPSQNLNAPFPGSLYHHNRCALQSVPDTDKEYPFLTRHMFSLAVPKLGFNFDRGNNPQIIHFGANLKVDRVNTSYADEWLDKFECSLLEQLVWKSAIVHFEHEVAGLCIVNYVVDSNSLMMVLDEFAGVGSRVEATLKWTRKPPVAAKAFESNQ